MHRHNPRENSLQGADKPRVLHVLKWLPRGGIETWLTHVFAATKDSSSVVHEVLLMQDEIGPYEQKVRDAGVAIHTLPMRGFAGWLLSLKSFLEDTGPYAIVHSHVNLIMTGPILVAARLAGVKGRIAHNHAARSMGQDYTSLNLRARDIIGRFITQHFATKRVGITEMAAEHLAGPNWRAQKNCNILLYGFDYSAFRAASIRAAALREELEIPDNHAVIGHVGRFDPVKNHAFLIDTFAEFLSRGNDATLVMVGRGKLKDEMLARCRELNIEEQARFIDGTDDIAAFMALFDVFVFPSFSEGLGIVLLEAQAGGAPSVVPTNMPAEAFVIEEAFTTISLDEGATGWAVAIENAVATEKVDQQEWLKLIEASPFGMQACANGLEAIYAQQLAEA